MMGLLFSVMALMPNALANAEHKYAVGPDLALAYKSFNFAILLLIILYAIRKPVRTFFSGRSAQLRLSIDEAKKAHDLAAKNYNDITKRLNNINDETKKIMNVYLEEGEAAKKKLIEDGQNLSARIKDDIIRISNSEIRKAKEELKAAAVELTIQLAEKTLKSEMDTVASSADSMTKSYIEKVGAINS